MIDLTVRPDGSPEDERTNQDISALIKEIAELKAEIISVHAEQVEENGETAEFTEK